MSGAVGPRAYRPRTVAELRRAYPELIGEMGSKPERDLDRAMLEHDATWRYQPSRDPLTDPGSPARGSFIEDNQALEQRAVSFLPKNRKLACTATPCFAPADIDGDGAKDLITTTIDLKTGAGLIEVLTARGARATFARGDAAGLDPLMFDQWQVTRGSELKGGPSSLDGDPIVVTQYSSKSSLRFVIYATGGKPAISPLR